MGRGQDLYKRAKKIIPGGTQLLSKRPEMFLPEYWPAYYSRAKGCEVWDLDNNHYYDVSYMGIGSNVLGYANEEVDAAAKDAIDRGSMCTLNAPEEVFLAEKLLKLHPWAGGVRYAKTGGEAMAQAIRIARAYTKKDVVLFCGYHGWHDWYLAANLRDSDALNDHHIAGLKPIGVPKALSGLAIPFHYNNINEFLTLANHYKGEIGVIVMEPIRNDNPCEEFMRTVINTAQNIGAVLIFDEITAGFRLCTGGSHCKLGYIPDMAVFGKAMTNGYPLSAIIGRKDVMEASQETFISSTFYTERIGFCAALRNIDIFEKENVSSTLCRNGKIIKNGWINAAKKYDINLEVGGIDPLPHFSFQNKESLAYKTYFVQEMLEKGFLASNAFYVSYAHTDEVIETYLSAVEDVFSEISEIQTENNIHNHLKGPICHTGFGRLI